MIEVNRIGLSNLCGLNLLKSMLFEKNKGVDMDITGNELYIEDLDYICDLDLPWEKMKYKRILITGATGMIGSTMIDSLMRKNEKDAINCIVCAMGRNKEKAKERFRSYFDRRDFVFIEHNINLPITENLGRFDYLIHLASNTHPVAYATDPIGTITTNILGIYNLLEYADKSRSGRVAFASSNEIYGENRGDTEKFSEDYCGYINCNTMRAGYQESKRCGESLCQAYIQQKGMDIVIPRLTRSYGPTLLSTDTKALSQFLKNGLHGEDIVLKSEGKQYYSYTYVADAVAGLLTVLLKGECGEAYNISDEASDIMLKDLAKIIADTADTKVVFELPDAVESAGFSTVTKARLDNSKIKELGFVPKYDIKAGIERTMKIIKEESGR